MLNKANIQDIVDLTPLQEGLLFHYLREEQDNYQNFEQICLHISGAFHPPLLVKAWQTVVAGNDMLRTLFRWKKLNNPVQITLKEHTPDITMTDLCSYTASQQETMLQQIRQQDKAARFNLEEVPFRVHLVQLSENSHVQIISNHSIIYDGWSNGLLLKAYFTTYFALLDGRPLPAFPDSKFRDFVRYCRHRDQEGERLFWSTYLKGITGKTSLQLESHAAGGLLSSAQYSKTMDSQLLQQVKTFCRVQQITEAVFFYTAWGILLQKVSNNRDVVFGTTVSGRSAGLKGVENMVGLLINTLPLRVQDRDGTIQELVQQVAKNIRERDEFQHTPFQKVREYAGLPLQEDLFDTIVLIENYPLDLDLFKKDDRCRIESFSFDQTNNFDIALSILHFDEAVEWHIGYNQHKYEEAVIRKLCGHFNNIMKEMAANDEKKLQHIEWMDAAEIEEVLFGFNKTETPYANHLCIHQLFEEQARLHPHQIALVYGNRQLSYGLLNSKANGVAQALREQLGHGNVLVPVMMERSIEMIIVLMGILKAGYTYIPFETSLPKARVQKLLTSLGATYIIDDTVASGLLQGTGTAWQPAVSNEALAYIIYTSGSTGLPKGVAVQHKPVINIIEWMNKTFQVNRRDRLLFVTSLGFDLSVYDIFGTLAAGAAICIAPRASLGDGAALLQLMAKEKITLWDSAPAAFQQVVQVGAVLEKNMEDNCLRLAFLSGDWIGLKLPGMAKALFGNVQVVSLGGATEAVIWSNYFLFDTVEEGWTSIPYGRPIQNAKYYILNDALQPLPKGMTGELYIGGECLAAGYINEIEGTAKKFVPSPFVPGERIYRTGDLARFFEDGNIELIGRKDFQVKIRGFRVELGEIENQLMKFPGIRGLSVLVDQHQAGEKYICAFYTGLPGEHTDSLRSFLREYLPEYMVPTYFIPVNSIPVTSNGKVDRNTLLQMVANRRDNKSVRPLSVLEKRLAQLWADVLEKDVEKIQAHTDFFMIGGHSLNATLLQARIEKEFDIRMPLPAIFQSSVIETMAGFIAAAAVQVTTIDPAPLQDTYPVTSGQKRLYSLQLLDEDKTTYNITGCLKITGVPDLKKMERVVNNIIQNQEALRTYFTEVNNQLVQVIAPSLNFNIEIVDGEGTLEKYIQPFDLAGAPLFRLLLVNTGNDTCYLLLNMHHIISDGLSVNKFLHDFLAGYAGKEILPPLLQYKDYAVWVNSDAGKARLNGQEKYWLQVFREGVPRLALPFDHARPAYQEVAGDAVDLRLPPHTLHRLQQLAQQADTTLFMTILALYKILLSNICCQDNVVTGIPVINRPHADLDGVIGFFVNTVPIKARVNKAVTLTEWVKQVKALALRAMENQEYPFERLAEKVDAMRHPGQNPVFDVVLEFDDLPLPDPHMEGLQAEVITDITRPAKFDLVLVVRPDANGITCKIEYATRLFNRSTIEWMAACWERLLNAVQPACLVGELNVMGKKEMINKEEIDFEL